MNIEKNSVMLGLKLPTDPRWADVAESNLEAILTDHAFCEQKAASNAISTIVRFPEYADLVRDLTAVAQEEMEHFGMVHDQITKRGWKLGFERKDPYVGDLAKHIRKGGNRIMQLVEALLFAAMIEARSCERFRVLSENISDPELAKFYHDLMISEAGHYTMFLKYARKYGEGVDVEKRWQEFLDYEAEIIQSYGTKGEIHG